MDCSWACCPAGSLHYCSTSSSPCYASEAAAAAACGSATCNVCRLGDGIGGYPDLSGTWSGTITFTCEDGFTYTEPFSAKLTKGTNYYSVSVSAPGIGGYGSVSADGSGSITVNYTGYASEMWCDLGFSKTVYGQGKDFVGGCNGLLAPPGHGICTGSGDLTK